MFPSEAAFQSGETIGGGVRMWIESKRDKDEVGRQKKKEGRLRKRQSEKHRRWSLGLGFRERRLEKWWKKNAVGKACLIYLCNYT